MKFQIQGEDGNQAVLDTAKAAAHWDEHTWWNGSNNISVATGSQWLHEDLYKSRKGNYYVVQRSNYEDVPDKARVLTQKEAALWLLANNHELPEDLAAFAQEIEE